MTLIGRRKTSKTPLQQVLGYLQIVLKALVAQRLARKTIKTYLIARSLPLIIGGAAVVAVVVFAAKKLLGGGAPDVAVTAPSPAQPESSPVT
jgi:hypothetical protein